MEYIRPVPVGCCAKSVNHKHESPWIVGAANFRGMYVFIIFSLFPKLLLRSFLRSGLRPYSPHLVIFGYLRVWLILITDWFKKKKKKGAIEFC